MCFLVFKSIYCNRTDMHTKKLAKCKRLACKGFQTKIIFVKCYVRDLKLAVTDPSDPIRCPYYKLKLV